MAKNKIKSSKHLVKHNKQYHMEILLNYFHLNGDTQGCDLQIRVKTWNYPAPHNKLYRMKVRLNSFHLNGWDYTELNLKVRTTFHGTINCTASKYCSLSFDENESSFSDAFWPAMSLTRFTRLPQKRWESYNIHLTVYWNDFHRLYRQKFIPLHQANRFSQIT